jgi:tRNA (adenine57-N1/adenine58-N1)-methyltransferase
MLREGELVYLLDDKGKRHFVTLSSGMMKVPGLGVLDGGRIIGHPEGVAMGLGERRLFAFRPGANELMESLERGPQVITPKDAATIVFRLDLKPGDAVLESGVGSGSLTTALLNAVGGQGMVISVELREDFAAKARRNVERSPFAQAWDLRVGDVATISVEAEVDAVMLDVPAPWEALGNVDGFLRPGGRFCAYVPNMNQLEAAVRELRQRGYVEIEALESIQRRMEVHQAGVRPSYDTLGHTGYLVFARRALRQGKA